MKGGNRILAVSPGTEATLLELPESVTTSKGDSLRLIPENVAHADTALWCQ